MIIILASIRIRPGKRSEFLDVFKANVPNVRSERGCVEYFPAVDVDLNLPIQQFDDHMVTVIEKWQDVEALRAHFNMPHMLEYRRRVKHLVESVSLKVLQEA
jgi:quinol monooxygenase YgiN